MTIPIAEFRFFHQTFAAHDLAIVGLLVILEGVLSVDNALVLGLLAKRLPKKLQHKALEYGLLGALIFRIIAIAAASFLLRWSIAKLLGGIYLIYVAIKHFVWPDQPHDHDHDHETPLPPSPNTQGEDRGEGSSTPSPLASSPKPLSTHAWRFWQTVLVIELTDIAFAVDSILAAIALVGQQKPSDLGVHDKLWVVITGGFLGVVLMRFAAILFIKLLEHFPRLEPAAYLLVIVIGLKLLADYFLNRPGQPARLDFHNPHHPEFWAFWIAMLIAFSFGFLPRKR